MPSPNNKGWHLYPSSTAGKGVFPCQWKSKSGNFANMGRSPSIAAMLELARKVLGACCAKLVRALPHQDFLTLLQTDSRDPVRPARWQCSPSLAVSRL